MKIHKGLREKICLLFDADNKKREAIYLKGGKTMNRYQTDYEYPFRQDSNFLYMTGIEQPDFEALILIPSSSLIIFCPRRNIDYSVWNGYQYSLEQYKNQYQADDAYYIEQLADFLESESISTLYVLDENTQNEIENVKYKGNINTNHLTSALSYSRLIKNEDELNYIRKACRVNDEAYKELLRYTKPGMYEYHMKAIHSYKTMQYGLIQDAYSGIFATGKNSAILHYSEHSSKIHHNDMVLVDAGYEYRGYASDYTRTFPASGKFSDVQKQLYNIVLEMQKKTLNAIRPQTSMTKLHLIAVEVLLQGLKEEQFITGSLDDLFDNNIYALFFPHGLGHLIGLDVHDVGGFIEGVELLDKPGFKHLRLQRELENGMVLTIEPGLYFIPILLKRAFEDPKQSVFLNKEKLLPLMDFGGIRIEDNVIVKSNGIENLTNVPKTVDDIEYLMQN